MRVKVEGRRKDLGRAPEHLLFYSFGQLRCTGQGRGMWRSEHPLMLLMGEGREQNIEECEGGFT